jgi:uncharacterized membrane protein YgcG
MRSLVGLEVKQTDAHTVTAYRTVFDNARRIAGSAITEPIAVQYFIQGLRPALRKRCLADFVGNPFTSVDAVHKAAAVEERKYALDHTPSKQGGAAPVLAHAQHPAQQRPQRKKSRAHQGKPQGGRGNGGGRGDGYGGGRGSGGRGSGRGGQSSGPSTDAPPAVAQGTQSAPQPGSGKHIHNHHLRCWKCHGRGHDSSACPTQIS